MYITKEYSQLDNKGFVVLNKFISKSQLSSLRKIVNYYLKANNNKSFFLTGRDFEKLIYKIPSLNKKVKTIFYSYSNFDNLKNYKIRKIYNVLRVISKSKMYSSSYDFHFDAHHYTILIPIYIPKGKKNDMNGHLMLFPNLRLKTNFLIINILQKIFYQNLVSKFILRIMTKLKKINYAKLIMKPGNAYLFNGFRSLHANENVDPNLLRATLIMHFYDCFEDSKLVHWNREFRKKIEQINIKKNSSI